MRRPSYVYRYDLASLTDPPPGFPLREGPTKLWVFGQKWTFHRALVHSVETMIGSRTAGRMANVAKVAQVQARFATGQALAEAAPFGVRF